MPQNHFAGENRALALTQALSPAERAAVLDELMKTVPTGREIDLGKPVIVPYRVGDPRNNYPKMVYNHDSGHVLTVADEKQWKAAQKRGFQEQPSLDHDYSKVKNNVAARKDRPVPREDVMSAAQLAELDEEEAKD